MTTERCLELWYDKELQRSIREECRRLTRDRDLYERCFSEAWCWISCSAPDDMDIDLIVYYAADAIFNEYRKELGQRKIKSRARRVCREGDEGRINRFISFPAPGMILTPKLFARMARKL